MQSVSSAPNTLHSSVRQPQIPSIPVYCTGNTTNEDAFSIFHYPGSQSLKVNWQFWVTRCELGSVGATSSKRAIGDVLNSLIHFLHFLWEITPKNDAVHLNFPVDVRGQGWPDLRRYGGWTGHQRQRRAVGEVKMLGWGTRERNPEQLDRSTPHFFAIASRVYILFGG